LASGGKRWLNVQSGEWGLMLSLILLLATNSLVAELAEVVATTGFINNIGTPQIVIVWLVSVPVTILAGGIYVLVIDRMKRVRLMTILLAILAFAYFLMLTLFTIEAPNEVRFALLYILTELQIAIFPLAFWSLVNDMYTITQARRLFPLVATGGALGSIGGNALAAALTRIFPENANNAPEVLTMGVIAFLLGILVVWGTFRKREVRARQSKQADGIRETFKEGWGVIKDVPMFRFLAVAMFLMGLSFTIIEFHFLYSLDAASQDTANAANFFQSFYGIYKALLIIGILVFQSLITARYLEKTGTRNSFFMLPVAMASGLVIIVLMGGAVGVGLGRLVMRVAQKGWDEPARKAAQALVPDERRGRVSTFMDSYFYAFASLAGALLLGALLLATEYDLISRETTSVVYLIVAAVAAVISLWAVFQLRRVYEKSLLNWRLSRSRRQSVLDGIEF